MSDSVWSHRWQPTRLPRPWDSPGKNTGVGCPFPSPMHESEKWKWSSSVMSDSSWPHGLQPTRLLCLWDFPGKSTGVGCHSLLQGIFPTQGSNLGLLHCRHILYHLSHQVLSNLVLTSTARVGGKRSQERCLSTTDFTITELWWYNQQGNGIIYNVDISITKCWPWRCTWKCS